MFRKEIMFSLLKLKKKKLENTKKYRKEINNNYNSTFRDNILQTSFYTTRQSW